MTKSTKLKRAYNSTHRQAQARQTRQQIAQAAQQLFSQRGYSGASIEAIAHQASVSPETIYAIFGSKQKILSYLVDITVGGDDEAINFLERPEPQAVFQETDQRQQLQMFARSIASVVQRVAPVFEVMRSAAKTEPDIADLLHRVREGRWRNMQQLVRRLAANGPLREALALDNSQAADIIWTLTSAEVFLLFTVDRGWSTDQYIDWLADSLIRLLLP